MIHAGTVLLPPSASAWTVNLLAGATILRLRFLPYLSSSLLASSAAWVVGYFLMISWSVSR
jgi:hypothetical protein